MAQCVGQKNTYHRHGGQAKTPQTAHIVYELKTPVCSSEHGSRKALDYLAKIQAGLVRETRADVGYTNFITKNPMHEHWRTEVWTTEAYELNYLADFVDLRPLTNKEKEYVWLLSVLW